MLFLGRRYDWLSAALAGLSLLWGTAEGFVVPYCEPQARSQIIFALHMGLYDGTPLPRPPNPEGASQKDDDDDILQETAGAVTERLFEFGVDGREIRDRLPPLQRRLESGIGCYYEPTDRPVLNLIDKTSVNPQDACWALEACRGDITEAWTRISTARRMILEESRMNALKEDDDGGDPDDYEEELREEYERQKLDRKSEMEKSRRSEYFKLSDKDEHWLPTKNPRPVDDEPWFTG